MPKLDTTIDNLERKSNKVTGTTPSASWTDTQYPSAKTLYNAYNNVLGLMHPVGSIYMTDTNTNPSTIFGGTWELIDKSFKARAFSVDSACWTNNTVSEVATNGIYATLIGNTVSIRAHIKVTDTVTDSTSNIVLGKLDLQSCGVTRLEYAAFGNATISDNGNCTVGYNFDSDGTVLITDILNINGTHTIADGNDFYISLVQPVKPGYMKDDFCDRFYWKRTA